MPTFVPVSDVAENAFAASAPRSMVPSAASPLRPNRGCVGFQVPRAEKKGVLALKTMSNECEEPSRTVCSYGQRQKTEVVYRQVFPEKLDSGRSSARVAPRKLGGCATSGASCRASLLALPSPCSLLPNRHTRLGRTSMWNEPLTPLLR